MTAGPEVLTGLQPSVELDGVRAALGGPAAVPDEMQPRLDALVAELLGACQPRGCLIELAITAHAPDRVALDDQALTGLGIAGLLQDSERLAAFSVNLGPGPKGLMDAATEAGRLLDLTLLDAIASEAVESLADQAQAEVERRCRAEQRGSTRRYSPGYCDWPLEQQAAFAAWGLFGPAGIELTGDFMMLPEKSVSAVMGIGPPGSLGKRLGRRPACKRCPMQPDCPGP